MRWHKRRACEREETVRRQQEELPAGSDSLNLVIYWAEPPVVETVPVPAVPGAWVEVPADHRRMVRVRVEVPLAVPRDAPAAADPA